MIEHDTLNLIQLDIVLIMIMCMVKIPRQQHQNIIGMISPRRQERREYISERKREKYSGARCCVPLFR